MKIGPIDNKSTPSTGGAERQTATGANGKTSNAEPSAKVELSAAANLRASGTADGTYDAKKVERLAQAIRDGTLEVDAGVIADKLIANAQELLGRTPS
jgi:negative regulator of flagellin synthesis FlgM